MTDAERLAAVRWTRVREVFDAVVDLPPPAREARLATLCDGDSDLRHEVASLLSYDDPADDVVDRLVAEAAAEAVGWQAGDIEPEFPPTSDRYRIFEKLGEGGMGEVFLAEDTILGRRVALKLSRVHVAGDPVARRRLLREARAAATLNHPHVCVVHEVGDGPDGRPFIAMEFIAGETLATRIQRGPLPAAEVIAVGRQAAGALDAAHALGVVHRDLKPSNIMFTAHGIKLLDFGLASATRDAGVPGAEPASAGLMGTVPYMSPEQVRAEPLDHRTDLFSLGVVLYEAATGRLPFEGPTPAATSEAILRREPTPLEDHAPDLPSGLTLAIGRALAKPRDARYQSAAALAQDLTASLPGTSSTTPIGPPTPSARTPVRRRWMARSLAAVVVVAAAALVVAYSFRPRPIAAPPPVDMAILLADFTNATGDPTFDGTLRQALVVQLQQTPFLRVFPPAGVQETLRQMTRPADTRLTATVAQEVARRRGISAWISGAIEPIERGFAITLVAARGDSGEVIARERVEAGRKGEVLPALGAAATRLRERLGESLQSIGQFNAPIQQATTASLDALKAYTLGAEQAARGDYAVAVALYQRAVQIDPEFAMGYQALAREQSNGLYPGDVVAASATRAYELRGRATEQERFMIELQYHSSVTGALERSIAAAERWKAIHPRDWQPYHRLADLYFSLGQYTQAVEAGREAVRLNPDVAPAYSNLAASLFALGRLGESREVYHRAMARGLDAPEYHAFLWRIAYYTGDADDMQRQLDWASASSTWAYNMPALAAILQGRWAVALQSSQQASRFFERRNMPGLVANAARYEAMAAALVGDCRTTRESAGRALKHLQAAAARATVVAALALCGDTGVAAFTEPLRRAYPDDTALNQAWLPVVTAAAALGRGRGAEAVAVLRARRYEDAAESWSLYLLGLALLQSGAGIEAEAEFTKIVDRPSRALWFPLAPLSRLGVARARTMAGDPAGSRRAYEAFFASWKDADPDLPVMVAARREYARLSPERQLATQPGATVP